jgi:hypothetical protein
VQHALFLERVCDLLFPRRTQLGEALVKVLTQLVKQLASVIVAGRCTSDARTKVTKADLLYGLDSSFGSVQPDCLAHGGKKLLCKRDDRVPIEGGTACGLRTFLFFANCSTHRGQTAIGELFSDRSLLWR